MVTEKVDTAGVDVDVDGKMVAIGAFVDEAKGIGMLPGPGERLSEDERGSHTEDIDDLEK